MGVVPLGSGQVRDVELVGSGEEHGMNTGAGVWHGGKEARLLITA